MPLECEDFGLVICTAACDEPEENHQGTSIGWQQTQTLIHPTTNNGTSPQDCERIANEPVNFVYNDIADGKDDT